jgi:hypothetical protein
MPSGSNASTNPSLQVTSNGYGTRSRADDPSATSPGTRTRPHDSASNRPCDPEGDRGRRDKALFPGLHRVVPRSSEISEKLKAIAADVHIRV